MDPRTDTAVESSQLGWQQAEVLDDLDLLVQILSSLGVEELAVVAGVSRKFREAALSDALWEPLCAARWQQKAARYHLTPARRAELVAEGLSWFAQYGRHEVDGRRNYLRSNAELSALTFDFTFRSFPTRAQSTSFRFEDTGRVSGHPNDLKYEWEVRQGGTKVQLGPFPTAVVHRLLDWHWAVANCNVVCTSLDVEGCPEEPSELLEGGTTRNLPPSYPRNAMGLYPELFSEESGEERTMVQLPDGRTVYLSESQYSLLLMHRAMSQSLSRNPASGVDAGAEDDDVDVGEAGDGSH